MSLSLISRHTIITMAYHIHRLIFVRLHYDISIIVQPIQQACFPKKKSFLSHPLSPSISLLILQLPRTARNITMIPTSVASVVV